MDFKLAISSIASNLILCVFTCNLGKPWDSGDNLGANSDCDRTRMAAASGSKIWFMESVVGSVNPALGRNSVTNRPGSPGSLLMNGGIVKNQSIRKSSSLYLCTCEYFCTRMLMNSVRIPASSSTKSSKGSAKRLAKSPWSSTQVPYSWCSARWPSWSLKNLYGVLKQHFSASLPHL